MQSLFIEKDRGKERNMNIDNKKARIAAKRRKAREKIAAKRDKITRKKYGVPSKDSENYNERNTINEDD